MSTGQAPDVTKFRLASNVSSQRIVNRGETVFVYADDLTGHYFATDLNTHLVLDAMSRGESFSDALKQSGVNAPAFLRILPHLVASGLISGGGTYSDQPLTKSPLESRLLFIRYECLDLSPVLRRFQQVGTTLFSSVGAASFFALLMFAAVSLMSHGRDLAAEAVRVLAPSTAQILWMAIVFWAVKIVHELGHGLALAHVLKAEGRQVPPIRGGIGTFFLMPYPFTNASATWLVENKWRRALVGAAGMYVEGFIAALAAIGFASVGDGVIRNCLFDVMVVAGVSTVVFNMNPLLRMDGYFILTDIFECPNLSSRAAMAARTAGVWAMTGRGGIARTDYGPAAYWLASYAYRWVTFGTILILAFHYDERAGWLVLAVTASMLIVRPLMATIAAVRAELKRPDARGSSAPFVMRPVVAIIAVAALLFVPADYGLVVEGRAENPAMRNIYAETSGIVTAQRTVADANGGAARGNVILRVDNPELVLREKAASADLELALLGLRQTLATDPERQGAQRERVAAARNALDEVRAEMGRAVSTLSPHETWHPDPKVRLDGAWTTPVQRRILGIVLPNSPPLLKAEIEHDALDLVGGDIIGRRAQVQILGEPQRSINANVVSVLEVAQQTAAEGQPPKRAFEITLTPEPGAILPRSLRLEGKRFEARIDRPWSSLAARAWDWLGRLTQKRFASPSRN